MPIQIVFSGVRQVEVREVAQEELSAHQIRVRTLYSAITHGTEMSIYQGTNPFFSKHIDDQGLFAPGQAEQFRFPFRYGYEQVGEVTEVGKEVANYRVGERITASYGHRSEAVITPVAHKNLPLPADAPPERFLFLPLGTVALDSFLTSRVRLGEGAVIFGLGTVGLLLVCLCRLGGVQPIIGVDFLDARLEAAKELGTHHLLNPRDSDVGPTVKELTADRLGTDVVFETSGSYAALHEAIRCGAPGYSRLVATSFYQNGGEFCG